MSEDTAVAEDTESQQIVDEDTKCCSLTKGNISPDHVFALRVVGWLTMFLAATQFGVGGTLFNYFDNVKLGAWWVGILAFLDRKSVV